MYICIKRDCRACVHGTCQVVAGSTRRPPARCRADPHVKNENTQKKENGMWYKTKVGVNRMPCHRQDPAVPGTTLAALHERGSMGRHGTPLVVFGSKGVTDETNQMNTHTIDGGICCVL
jgi:hypothetical protein